MENIQSELYLYTIRQKTSVKRGGTNPKAKNYKSVSKSIFETAPPRTMFGFVQRKIMSDPILRSSKKKFAHLFFISSSEIQKP